MKIIALALALPLLTPALLHAQQPGAAVEGVSGVRQDAIARIRPEEKVLPVPPPPPVASSVASVQAVRGVTGIESPRARNLEAAILLKQGAHTPPGTGAEQGGKGKAAAAALLAAPLDKPAPKTPKEDGRAGFQEFEKLQNRGS